MKKGQAAMEFLMNYGWAILVVLICFAALFYFGILSTEKFEPKCHCSEFNMTYFDDIMHDDIRYIECISTETYIDYEEKRISFKSDYKLFFCDTELGKLIEVE